MGLLTPSSLGQWEWHPPPHSPLGWGGQASPCRCPTDKAYLLPLIDEAGATFSPNLAEGAGWGGIPQICSGDRATLKTLTLSDLKRVAPGQWQSLQVGSQGLCRASPSPGRAGQEGGQCQLGTRPCSLLCSHSPASLFLAWPRYRIIGVTDSGQFNLEITNAELSDDALYECQATEAALRSRRAKLTVLSECLGERAIPSWKNIAGAPATWSPPPLLLPPCSTFSSCLPPIPC